jgi:hypothetical protein
MTVTRTRTITEEIRKFAKTIPKEKAPFDNGQLDNLRNNASVFVSTDNDEINGLLFITMISIDKRPYVKVTACSAKSDEAYNDLVEALVDYECVIKSDGIFTDPFDDEDDRRASAFKKYKLKKYQSVYSIRKADLLPKVRTKPTLRWALFSKKTRSILGPVFMKFLVEYDILLAKKRNEVLGHQIFKTALERDRTQKIRISYFMDGVIKSDDWTACILFKSDEPIGFVKGLTVNGLCYPEIFLLPKYIKGYREAALAILIREIKADIIGFMCTDNETEYSGMYESLAGKPLGHSYVYI